jgi:hypothetical protein
MKLPTPVCGVPSTMRPRIQMPISLYFRAGEISWNGNANEPATKKQLESAIDKSRGHCLPNGILPALDPGDVVVLSEGVYWLDRDWKILPISKSI